MVPIRLKKSSFLYPVNSLAGRCHLRGAPASEMNALFGEDLERTNALFARTQHRHAIGAFEDANYEASGYYRPAMQCIMFDRRDFARRARTVSARSLTCTRGLVPAGRVASALNPSGGISASAAEPNAP
jgi:hypothetical protein